MTVDAFSRAVRSQSGREFGGLVSVYLTNALQTTRVLGATMDARRDALESQMDQPEAQVCDWEDFLTHARLILGVVCTITVCLGPASLGKDCGFGPAVRPPLFDLCTA